MLGSDTVVVLEGEILGKPRDAAHARRAPRAAGRAHAHACGPASPSRPRGPARPACAASRAGVTLRAAGEQELRAYVASGEPLDKAGAYALQGEGRRFVSRVEGSESNVIGLPLDETLALLAEAGCERG